MTRAGENLPPFLVRCREKGNLSISLRVTGGPGEPGGAGGVAFRIVSLPSNGFLGPMRSQEDAMWRAVLVAIAMFLAAPARAGEWQYDPATDTIFYGSLPVAQWYAQPRPMQTEARRRYSPQRVARYPHGLRGYPLPIYRAPSAWPVEPTYRGVSTHFEWCAARYRSYDLRTDSFQPHHGPRRYCRSPY